MVKASREVFIVGRVQACCFVSAIALAEIAVSRTDAASWRLAPEPQLIVLFGFRFEGTGQFVPDRLSACLTCGCHCEAYDAAFAQGTLGGKKQTRFFLRPQPKQPLPQSRLGAV
jgi:hypothetical protein